MQTVGRVVVVDDEPVILDLLVTVLKSGPWQVDAFRSGAAARDHLLAHGADVLLTDKNLPDVGGLELVALLKEHDPAAECIVITGFPSLDTALEAMQLSVFDYIVKPPRSIFEVRQKVERAWGKVSVVRENRRLVDALQDRNAALLEALERLQSTQTELIQSEKLAGIGTLAAGVAHEVSSPLFGILGLAEAIVDEDDVEVVHEHAAEIVEYSKHIRDIVTELTRYSRSSRDEYRTTVTLASAIADAAKLVARSVRFPIERIVIDADPELVVLARTNEVQQIFVNLIKNAIEATLEGESADSGIVTVTALKSGAHVEVSVLDQGPGIDADAVSLVFDPFYTTKPPGEGTGLGLNIVYRIVTRYSGSISVSSPPGAGACFVVRMPRSDAEQA